MLIVIVLGAWVVCFTAAYVVLTMRARRKWRHIRELYDPIMDGRPYALSDVRREFEASLAASRLRRTH